MGILGRDLLPVGMDFVMSTSTLRQRVNKQIDSLSPQRLRTAADFLAYLEQKPGKLPRRREASQSSVTMRLRKRLKQAEKQVDAGDIVPVENLRRKP